jgi:parallel beta-helix repeat protein
MKLFLLLPFIIFTLSANATDYYVSANGNDANMGTSTSTPWRTLDKVNSYFSSLQPGDRILLNRGDIFYGSIIPSKGFTDGNPITFGAYGSGANPVITGFTTVTNWTNLGGNIWESTSAISTLNDANMVVINGINTAMGRYPNTGWLNVDSHTGNTSITSSSLNSSVTNWTGADLVMKVKKYAIQRNLITSASGSTIKYNAINSDNAADGYGFFIENDARTLDIQNEWYYNPSTKKIRIYSSTSPSNVQVSTLDTLVYITRKSNFTFDGIDFTGSNRRAFYLGSAANVTIQNCNFNYHGLYVIWGGNNYGSLSSNFNFNHNTVNNVNSKAIDLGKEFVNPYIGYSTFKNCGVFYGMFKNPDSRFDWDGAFGVIFTNDNVNGLVAEYNLIDGTGFNGIHFQMSTNARVNNNEITNFCLLLMDGGGIYTYSGSASYSKIFNNIIHGGYGDNSGTSVANDPTERLAHGIYLDGGMNGSTKNIEVYNNTCFNNALSGIYSNGNAYCNFYDNTCYNNDYTQMQFVSNDAESHTEIHNTVKNNISVARTNTQLTGKFDSRYASIDFFDFCDNNYYARPIDDNVTFFVQLNYYTTFLRHSLAQWQSYSGFDANSRKSPKSISNINDLRIEYNATSSNKTISLDGNYIDVRNVNYNGTITLAPYTSAVLIRNGAATNQPPVSNAGNDQTITLPTNTINLSGGGTASNGSISLYSWVEISGPNSASITNTTTPSTTATGLIQGVYKFVLKVTDNLGSTAMDTMQVTVNTASSSSYEATRANAGNDQTITLPVNSIDLSGSGTTAPNRSISSYFWVEISGPNSAPITNTTIPSTTATGLVQGVYKFVLRVTDDLGAITMDTMQVTVNTASSFSPYEATVANAGIDQTITLPTNMVSLSGNGKTALDRSIASYFWVEISGPNSAPITNTTTPSTTATGLIQGVYKFVLRVTDDLGTIVMDTMQVTVLNLANGLLPAVNITNAVNGLDYKYYEGTNYNTVPDFSSITPLKLGSCNNFDLTLANRSVIFSFNYTGYINVPLDGQYTFYTTSDDGSNLYIDNVLVVNNDGLHAALEQSGTIGLKAGKHYISVGYFQQGGGSILNVGYQGPGISKQVIPASALYRISLNNNLRRGYVGAATVQRASDSTTANQLIRTGIKAYPNPFTNSVTISISGGATGTYKLLLIDAAGRTLFTKSGIKTGVVFEQSINTSSLQKGIYFLKIVQNENDNTSTIKLEK